MVMLQLFDILLARRLSVDGYSEWAYFFSILSLLFFVGWFGVGSSARISASTAASAEEKKEYVKASLVLQLAVTAVVALLLFLFAQPLAARLGYPERYPSLLTLLRIGSGILFLSAYMELFKNLYQGLEEYRLLALMTFTEYAGYLVFAAVFVPALFYSLIFIPQNINAGLREKELQLELQENQMSVMLSQIQPHFLYNALSAICDLCGSEPLKARDALVDFSVYLRENMDSISSKPVRFYNELSHIDTYLKLEKLRFGDKINVVYDIEAEDFEIQPLTVQPIVENAVKHGICMKENGGTITLKTSEENGSITITVTDDGVGFDVNSTVTEGSMRSHIGLENVRKRVEKYPGGKLTVESEIGKGTVVTISFRK